MQMKTSKNNFDFHLRKHIWNDKYCSSFYYIFSEWLTIHFFKPKQRNKCCKTIHDFDNFIGHTHWQFVAKLFQKYVKNITHNK